MEKNWLDKNEYPFTPYFFDVEGHKMHFIDEGKGETVLFIHGTPSWSFDFRNVIRRLKSDYRCIAIDHMGFGLSDKPEKYDYTTINHSRVLESFILSKGLKDITLVVHDFGGPVGLNFAVKYPDLVKKIVVINSWLWSSKNDPEYIRLSRILKSPLLPILYRYLNFSPGFLLPASFGQKKITKKLLKHYTKPFGKVIERNGPIAFAKSLLNDQEWFQKLWEKRDKINKKPFLLIWGMKDPLVKPHYLEKFREGFPGAKVLRLDTAGHFPQEEEPYLVAQALKDFMEKS